MSPEANQSADVDERREAAIADPDIPTGYDPEAIAELMRANGVDETRIATVERPDGFLVALRDGAVVEIGE